ncbi:MAG: DEAD/DEAH box helicase family protein [Leptospira sp.]|nr:DEAD/DEAH box helicase family protein [Leptospira sp.]
MDFTSNFLQAEFIYPWRIYQERILKKLDLYLDDRKVHIIAPPGSGKTVLGLEIIRRLGKKTLVLSPTIAIRNQWINRWLEDFHPPQNLSQNLFSTDIREESFLYSSTYQSIYSAFKRDNAIPKCEVLVVDEAHHLRREWWKALEALVKDSQPIIVALTATPPWDVEESELRNYLELCGGVDEEISVPELVASGDLCPHQDYLHMSVPDDSLTQEIRNFQNISIETMESIPRIDWIGKFLEIHPYFVRTESSWDDIYKNTNIFLSMVILWKATGRVLPQSIIEVLESEKIFHLPEWDNDYATEFVQSVIFAEKDYPDFGEEIKEFRKELRGKTLLHGKRVDFKGKNTAHRFLTEGSSKISGIREILEHEEGSLKENLRILILTDFIRKEELQVNKQSSLLGTVPIYKSIFPRWGENLRFCHISGSLIIVPGSLRSKILEKDSNAKFKELNELPGAMEWIAPSQVALPILTEFLGDGTIQGIVGTMSLLGEGWDAPSINSLILATSVGSYMLSNQSRGRAIRIDKKEPFKTANIWHLVLMEPSAWEGDFEFTEMERRFRAFAGPSFYEPISIETGIARMGIQSPNSLASMQELNLNTFVHADDRQRLRKEWEIGISSGESFAERLEVKGWEDPFQGETTKGKSYSIFGLWNLAEAMVLYLGYFFQGMFRDFLWSLFGNAEYAMNLSYIIFIPAIMLLPKWFRSLRDIIVLLFWKNTRKKLANVVFNSLVQINLISKDSDLTLDFQVNADDTLDYVAKFGLLREREYFIRSLEDLLKVPVNPRYLIRTSPGSIRFFGVRYFNVPEVFGRNKDTAEIFHRNWTALLGSSELIYTRTPAGRESIFRSRIKSIFRKDIDLRRGGVWA